MYRMTFFRTDNKVFFEYDFYWPMVDELETMDFNIEKFDFVACEIYLFASYFTPAFKWG